MADKLALFIAFVAAVAIGISIYFYIKNQSVPAVVVPTSTTNGYISSGTITPITTLPVTISGATYVNYTSTIPFSVIGTSTTGTVTTTINSASVTTYTVSADTISIVISAAPPTSTTNGYIAGGIIVPIASIPVTVTNATYLNYTGTVPFTVTGSSTIAGVLSAINTNISSGGTYTVSGDSISVALSPNTTLTPILSPLTPSSASLVSNTPPSDSNSNSNSNSNTPLNNTSDNTNNTSDNTPKHVSDFSKTNRGYKNPKDRNGN